MKKRKVILALLAIVIITIVAVGLYWYNKPRNSLADAEPAFTITAVELYASFKENEQEANEKFLGKIILVSGITENITDSDSSTSILLSAGDEIGGINCQLNQNDKSKSLPAKGTNIKIKGKCIGFLLDVNLSDAVLKQ